MTATALATADEPWRGGLLARLATGMRAALAQRLDGLLDGLPAEGTRVYLNTGPPPGAAEVYVALAGKYHEGTWIVGLSAREERARQMAEENHARNGGTGPLQWEGQRAEADPGYLYYEVRRAEVEP